MSTMLSERPGLLSAWRDQDRDRDQHGWDRWMPARRTDEAGTSHRLLIGGLILLGLGCLAWYYVGPDMRRYMKIRSM